MNQWFNIHQADEAAHVLLSDDFGFDDGPGVEGFREALGAASKVYLTVDCTGGSLPVALAVYDELKKRDTVCTIRRAWSGGALVAMAANHIAIAGSASMMLHSPQAMVYGGPMELREEADNLVALAGPMLEIFASRTGKPVATVKRWLERDTYFSASEAVANRLADEILPARRSNAPRSRFKLPEVTIGRTVAPHASESAALDTLRAVGPVQTTNKARLARELTVWLNQVQQI